jgi:hypothetical protein
MDALFVMPVAIIAVLVACLAVFYAQRDRRSAPPHEVSRMVWCESRHRYTVVRFREQMRSGLVTRRVLDCPFRASGQRCVEACGWLPTV